MQGRRGGPMIGRDLTLHNDVTAYYMNSILRAQYQAHKQLRWLHVHVQFSTARDATRRSKTMVQSADTLHLPPSPCLPPSSSPSVVMIKKIDRRASCRDVKSCVYIASISSDSSSSSCSCSSSSFGPPPPDGLRQVDQAPLGRRRAGASCTALGKRRFQPAFDVQLTPLHRRPSDSQRSYALSPAATMQ